MIITYYVLVAITFVICTTHFGESWEVPTSMALASLVTSAVHLLAAVIVYTAGLAWLPVYLAAGVCYGIASLSLAYGYLTGFQGPRPTIWYSVNELLPPDGIQVLTKDSSGNVRDSMMKDGKWMLPRIEAWVPMPK